MRYALIQSGIVAAVVEQNSTPTIPGQWLDVTGLHVGPGYLWDGSAWTASTPIAQPRHITAYAFKSRMTAAERIGIRTAAQSSAAVYDWLDLADSARYIDLDLPATRAGVQGLELAGLLATGRALEILDAPVQDVERP